MRLSEMIYTEEEMQELEKENKKLKEFKTKREESMFYFKALVERVEPINSKEAEELQRYKKLFERLYREELYYLEEENKNLKEENEALKEWVAKWMSYKNTYNDVIPKDENWFYKEVKPTC